MHEALSPNVFPVRLSTFYVIDTSLGERGPVLCSRVTAMPNQAMFGLFGARSDFGCQNPLGAPVHGRQYPTYFLSPVSRSPAYRALPTRASSSLSIEEMIV